jgi:lipid II:glycine glycyltransferase (peptidoglycan interpeptide bridge formation enzyme)
MTFCFSDNLNNSETSQIIQLFDEVEFSDIEQYPTFANEAYLNEKVIHALMFSETKLEGYAQIKIKKHLIASIYFGPLVRNEESFKVFVNEIKKYCFKKFIPILKIIPASNSINYSKEFWTKCMSYFRFYNSDREFNWATLVLKINVNDETLLKSFADNHKQSIKKAIKLNLKVDLILESELHDFNIQYCEMYKARSLPIDITTNYQKFKHIYDFLNQTKKGFFMGVKFNNELIGGACITFGNNFAFYLEGYSHPNYKKIPINHYLLYECMKYSREKGCQYFDFGGYSLNADKGDQLYNINKFKEAFGGEIVIFPKTMVFTITKSIQSLFIIYRKIKAHVHF